MSERCHDCGRKEQDPPGIRSGIMRDQCQTCGRLFFPPRIYKDRITDTLTLLEKGLDCGTGELCIEGHDDWDREQFLEALKGILMGENKE